MMRTGYIRALTVGLAAALAVSLLALLAGMQPAQAAFPGKNGKIAFSSDRDGDSDIFVMNDDGTGSKRLTDRTEDDYSPTFSPDASKIAFVGTDPSGEIGNVFIMNADGSEPSQLTNNDSASLMSLDFSADGERIAYETFRDGALEIFAINADGSGSSTNLTNNPADDGSPAFSPDNKKMAFTSDRDGDFDLYVTNADGSGTPVNLTNGSAAGEYDPAYSPDGKRIAFISDRSGHRDVYVMNADGTGTPARLTNDLAYKSDPTFSSDGKKVLFYSNRDGDYDIYSLNADGSGTPVNLTNNPGSDFSPDFKPDTTAPTVTGVSPAEGATNVPRNTSVTATFSEAMNEDALKNGITLTNLKTGKQVAATVTVGEDGKNVTLDPSGKKLAKKKQHKVTIKGAKDLAGNTLPNEEWTFTTGKK